MGLNTSHVVASADLPYDDRINPLISQQLQL